MLVARCLRRNKPNHSIHKCRGRTPFGETFRLIVRLTKLAILATVLAIGSAAGQTGDALRYKAAMISFNPSLGDLAGNLNRIETLVKQAVDAGAKVVVVPEQSTSGFEITKAQAESGLAIEAPFTELNGLRSMARAAEVVVALGIVEKDGGHIYNSAAMILPSGTISVQRKRLASASFGWNDRGNTPIDIYDTPYGKLAVLICADSFLMDWVRIAAVKGAEVVLLPSNWWGSNSQLDLWSARAKENGLWILAANRWGMEPNSYPPPHDLYMSDGPSAAIDPNGNVVAAFEADDESPMADHIIYVDVALPPDHADAYTIASRRPAPYADLGNTNYTPGGTTPKNLPTPGKQAFEILSYQPTADAEANLAAVSSLLKADTPPKDALILLPGLGLATKPIAAHVENLADDDFWMRVMGLVRNYSANGLVTSVAFGSDPSKSEYLATVLVRSDTIDITPQLHDAGLLHGSGLPLHLTTLKYGLAAIVTGADSLFPELGAVAAKDGADFFIVTSEFGTRGTEAAADAAIDDSIPRGWTWDSLATHWRIMGNGCFHVAASDASGYSLAETRGAYCSASQSQVAFMASTLTEFDTNSQRQKNLNWYYDFDLETLLGSARK